MYNYLKVMGVVVMGFCIMMGIGMAASYIGYQRADAIYYEQLAGIVGKVAAHNPESESVVVESLRNLDTEEIDKGKQILKLYGYEQKFLVLPSQKSGFKRLVEVNMIAISIMFLGVVLVGYGVYRRLKYRFNALQDYLMAIANGNYSLHIDGVGEGKFSLFEDQIYKTTLALRESKEVQEKEKLNLARNIADMSHQLKTPLTSMSIMTDVLLENDLDEQNQCFVHQLNKQIERLSGLVSTLLKLAQFDAGTVALKTEKIVVGNLLEEVLEMLEMPIRHKQLKIHLEGPEEVWVTRDRKWLYEAIHNVLYNCVQHSPHSGSLTIQWSHNPIYTEIVIQDQGGGIPLEDLPHIFTRFYKGKNAPSESVGIGLAMAKAIIEKQNGEMKAQNIENGARFYIKFY